MKQLLSVFAVLAAGILAFLSSTVWRPQTEIEAVGSIPLWQTYCATESEPTTTSNPSAPFSIEEVGRPSEKIRSGHLLIADGDLIAWDVANREQFDIGNGTTFSKRVGITCPKFSAYGWTISHDPHGSIFACRGNAECRHMSIMPKTIPLSVAAANGGIFVGTSQGDNLLFRDGRWCRMTRHGERYRCAMNPAPIVTKPDIQFYGSTPYNGAALIGEYPTGRLFVFDGKTVSPSSLSPPQFADGTRTGYESQSVVTFCGNLLVGYWPNGEIYRYDGNRWHDPIRLFNSKPSPSPHRQAAERAGLIFNFFGQRVPSLVAYNGALYAITSNKGDWSSRITPDIALSAQEQYGTVFKLTQPGCLP